MNKLVNNNKGNLRTCYRLFNKKSIVTSNYASNATSSTKSAFSIPQYYSQNYMHILKKKSLSFQYSQSYQFSMKHSNSENSSQYDEQELAAIISDSVLRQAHYGNSSNSDQPLYSSGNPSNSSSSNKVQKDLKNQQYEQLSKIQSSQQQGQKFTQEQANTQANQRDQSSQNRNLKGNENSQLNSSISIEQQQCKQEKCELSQDQSSQNQQDKVAQLNYPKKFKFNDFCELTKFRLSVTNTLVALPTYLYLAESVSPALIPLGIATQLMAMSSQTANQIMEKDFDKQMTRTQRRPLPSGILTTKQASLLALSLYTASNAIFLYSFPLHTALVANAIFFGYIAIYTPMKRVTTFNTTIGAIVGALTPYIGYTAAGGAITDLYPLYYSLYMIFWQFQHFYGISWIYKNDYKKAGYKMCDEKSEALFYMLSSFGINVAANYALFFTNPVFPYLSIAYSAAMAATYVVSFAMPTYKFYQNPNIQNAKLLKNSSYIHLSVFFLIIIIDMCIRIYENKCKIALENKPEAKPIKKLDEQSMLGKVHKILFEKKPATNSNISTLSTSTVSEPQSAQQSSQIQQTSVN